MDYKNSYVAFLDVLGFKKLVYSKSNDDKEKIKCYFEIIKNEIKTLKEIDSKKEINYIVISDSIIITIEQNQDNDKSIDNLRQLCIAVGKIQYKLALHDIWLRGGISSGETYIDSDEKQIVGAGYINAYLLEEKHAMVPRVIIDNKIVYELGLESCDQLISKINKIEYFFEGEHYLFIWNWDSKNAIKIEQDIPLFVNYFYHISDDELMTIMNNIQESIYAEIGLYKKFKWVANYLISYLEYLNRRPLCRAKYNNYIGLLKTL